MYDYFQRLMINLILNGQKKLYTLRNKGEKTSLLTQRGLSKGYLFTFIQT